MAAGVRAAPGDDPGAPLGVGLAGALAVEGGADGAEADRGPAGEAVRAGGFDAHPRDAARDPRQILEQRPQRIDGLLHRECAFQPGPAVRPGRRALRAGCGRRRGRQVGRIDLEGLEGSGGRRGGFRAGRLAGADCVGPGGLGGSGGRPVEFTSLRVAVRARRPFAPALPCDLPHRRDDPHVAGAPAEVAAELAPDRRIVHRREAGDDVPRRDQHPRRAEAALQGVMPRERIAQRLPDRIVSQAFHGDDLGALAGVRIGDAGADRTPVHEHRARPAHPVLAAEMGAGEVQVVAQQLGELRPRRDGGLARLAVDGEADGLHVTSCDTFPRRRIRRSDRRRNRSWPDFADT